MVCPPGLPEPGNDLPRVGRRGPAVNLSLSLACIWVLVATVIALVPMRSHWPAAYVLAAVGIPIVGFVTFQNGPIAGMLVLAGGASMLRWPLVHLWRWLKARRREPAE